MARGRSYGSPPGPNGGLPQKTSERVIATGFREHTGPNALIVGPTGLSVGTNGDLYVADAARNRVAAIPNRSPEPARSAEAGEPCRPGML